MNRSLSDPAWTDGPTECVQCGYSLAGLATPGKCPECGAPYDAQVMLLHGVARSSKGGPLWRKVVWGVLIGLAVIFSQAAPLILIFSWILLLAGFATILCGVVFMFATGKRERSGTERFMFTSAGVARLPQKRDDRGPGMDAVFVPYSSAGTLRIDTISPYWRRIRIFMPNQSGVPRLVFDAGFRCPTADVDRVQQTILAAMRGDTYGEPPTRT